MKTKFIATSVIIAMLTTFGTAHANTTKPAKDTTQECKPPHDFKGKQGEKPSGQKPTKNGDRPEPPKGANGKPMPPKDAKKDGCPPPPNGQAPKAPTQNK